MHELERPDRYGENIQIQDRAFECIFDFLDGYDWVLDPTHQDIGLRNADPQRTRKEEINPDVLGYIFEKYINAIQPGEQKAKGAYYTKEDITEYISKNTVLPFLFNAARAKCKVAFENLNGPTVWDLLKSDPDRYPAVRHGLTWDYQSDHPQRGMPLERPHELPDAVAAGLNPPTLHKPVGDGPVETLELRRAWNKPAPAEYALPTEIWREAVARRKHYEDIKTKLAAGEVRDINDLITLNLDIRQ